MGREWKPGDVAIRTHLSSPPMVSIVVSGEWCPEMQSAAHPDTLHWHHQDGGWDQIGGRSNYRPLAVIDSEDREHVERLVDDWTTSRGLSNVEHMQAVLREFANPTPPKPDEPQGLGAVVATDADGDFIRVSVELANPWLNVQTARHFHWDAIAAVRILSEGVQP